MRYGKRSNDTYRCRTNRYGDSRRMGYGMKIVVGDKRMENAQSMADTMNRAGFDVLPVEMDLSSASPFYI